MSPQSMGKVLKRLREDRDLSQLALIRDS